MMLPPNVKQNGNLNNNGNHRMMNKNISASARQAKPGRYLTANAFALSALFAATLLIAPLAGCGGGGHGKGFTQSATASSKKGSVSFTVQWPDVTKGRVIPAASGSIVLTLARTVPGPSVAPVPTIAPLTPPPAGQATNRLVTRQVDGLELGTYTVTATAYPNADGTGVPQAIGTGTVQVVPDNVNTVALTMNAEVRTLTLTPAINRALYVGRSRQYLSTATNAAGQIVLVAPQAIVYTSSDTSVATVDANGVVTITGAGTANIRAEYKEPFTGSGQEGTGAFATVTVTGVINVADEGLARSSWPKFHGNAQSNGAAFTGAPTTGVQKWQKTVDGPVTFSSPAVDENGNIYVGALFNRSDMATTQQNFYSFDANGTLRWQFATGGDIESSPAIARDGTVYVGSYDGNLYAVTPDGIEKWRFQADGPVAGPPAVGRDGKVYVPVDLTEFGIAQSGIVVLNPDGSVFRRLQTFTGGFAGGISFSADATTIYAGSLDGNVYAFNSQSLALRWRYATNSTITTSTPAVDIDGSIYVGAQDGRLYALTPGGTPKNPNGNGYIFEAGSPIYDSPAIDGSGNIYFGTFDSGGIGNNRVFAVAPDGTQLWQYQVGDGITSSPAIGLDGTVYIGSYDGYLYALAPDGSLKWRFLTGDNLDSSPSIGADGTIFIGGYNSRVFAVK